MPRFWEESRAAEEKVRATAIPQSGHTARCGLTLKHGDSPSSSHSRAQVKACLIGAQSPCVKAEGPEVIPACLHSRLYAATACSGFERHAVTFLARHHRAFPLISGQGLNLLSPLTCVRCCSEPDTDSPAACHLTEVIPRRR